VIAIGPERKRFRPKDGGERKGCIEMGKQISASRGLVAQSLAELVRIDRYQKQIALTREVPRGCFSNLRRGRKMEVPIMNINRGSIEETDVFGISPEGLGADFIDGFHEGVE
jgi:hypothetical protein